MSDYSLLHRIEEVEGIEFIQTALQKLGLSQLDPEQIRSVVREIYYSTGLHVRRDEELEAIVSLPPERAMIELAELKKSRAGWQVLIDRVVRENPPPITPADGHLMGPGNW